MQDTIIQLKALGQMPDSLTGNPAGELVSKYDELLIKVKTPLTEEEVEALIGMILSILVDTFISKISFPMQPGPEIGSILSLIHISCDYRCCCRFFFRFSSWFQLCCAA